MILKCEFRQRMWRRTGNLRIESLTVYQFPEQKYPLNDICVDLGHFLNILQPLLLARKIARARQYLRATNWHVCVMIKNRADAMRDMARQIGEIND